MHARAPEDIELRNVRGRRCDDRSGIEQPSGGEEFLAFGEVAPAFADVPGASGMLVDNDGLAFASDILLDDDPVGAGRNRRSGWAGVADGSSPAAEGSAAGAYPASPSDDATRSTPVRARIASHVQAISAGPR